MQDKTYILGQLINPLKDLHGVAVVSLVTIRPVPRNNWKFRLLNL